MRYAINSQGTALVKFKVNTLIIVNSTDELLSVINLNPENINRVAYKNATQVIHADILQLLIEHKNKLKNNIQLQSLPLRQRQCAELLLEGMSNKQIANNLHLSTRTIEDYIAILKTKFAVKTKLELVLKINDQKYQ